MRSVKLHLIAEDIEVPKSIIGCLKGNINQQDLRSQFTFEKSFLSVECNTVLFPSSDDSEESKRRVRTDFLRLSHQLQSSELHLALLCIPVGSGQSSAVQSIKNSLHSLQTNLKELLGEDALDPLSPESSAFACLLIQEDLGGEVTLQYDAISREVWRDDTAMLPVNGTTVLKSTLFLRLKAELIQLIENAFRRRDGESDALRISGPLLGLLSPDCRALNPLAHSDFTSVIHDQLSRFCSKTDELALRWDYHTLSKILERCMEKPTPMDSIPFTEEDARELLDRASTTLNTKISLLRWTQSLQPSATISLSEENAEDDGGKEEISEVIPSEQCMTVSAQIGRWLSYIPSGYSEEKEQSYQLLAALERITEKPMAVALRLNALGLCTSVNLALYSMQNGFSDDAGSMMGEFLETIAPHSREDQAQLRFFIRENEKLVREALKTQSKLSTAAAPLEISEVGTPLTISKRLREWCQNTRHIIEDMAVPFIERKHVCALMLLGLISGNNVFIHGPPGAAKSMLSRRLFDFYEKEEKEKTFSIVLNKTTLPEELFGPISLKSAKQDRFVRNTEGYLPSASLAFIDEIWNATSAILNGLLSISNERLFRNGEEEIRVPLLMLVAASTDLPTSAALRPFYDRFMLKVHLERLLLPNSWSQMLSKRVDSLPGMDRVPPVPAQHRVSSSMIKELQRAARRVPASERVRYLLANLPTEFDKDAVRSHQRVLDISERSLCLAQDILQVAALVRHLSLSADAITEDCQIELVDCALLDHMLWDKPQDSSTIERVFKSLLANVFGRYPLKSQVEKTAILSSLDTTPWYPASTLLKPGRNGEMTDTSLFSKSLRELLVQ